MALRRAPGGARGVLRCAAPLLALLALPACGTLDRLSDVGRPPEMAPTADPTRQPSYRPLTMPIPEPQLASFHANSLWRSGSRAFFKDQRASQAGDIITILVNITDAATLQNASNRSNIGDETLGLPSFFGLEGQIPKILAGASSSALLGLTSKSDNTGIGAIKRNETITLRLAGVITQVLSNGNLVVSARQQVRVNSELRDLLVSGVIRPQDIASDNTILHDRLAEARISYGGKGQLTEVQTPRYGQQILDTILPF